MGPDLVQITNQMRYKNPGDGVSFQMHQDCTFRKPDAAYRDHGVRVTVDGKVVPLTWGPKTRWDIVEKR